MNYQVTHRTKYDYGDPVSVAHHIARITPRSLPGQGCLSHSIEIHPPAALVHERVDYFGNLVRFFSLQQSHDSLTVTARSVVTVEPVEAPELASSVAWAEARRGFLEDEWPADLRAHEFAFPSPLVPKDPELGDYASACFEGDKPFLECVRDLNSRIHADFVYDPRATHVATPLAEVWKERRGVCQDFAHLEIACLRALGIAARYVSGYLETVPPPGKPRLTGADASHAWISVFCPGSGWCDFDPTNDLIPSTRHITVAWGRDFSDVSPLHGVILGGSIQVLKVNVDVAPTAPNVV